MRFYIKTYGCLMNEYDSLMMRNLLISEGFKETKSIEIADIIIFNTCAVRENAEDKFYGRVNQLNFKDKIFIATGCIAQEDKEEILKKTKGKVKIVLGSHQKHNIVKALKSYLKSKKDYISTDFTYQFLNLPINDNNINFRGYIPISIGCSNVCTYCIVPYVRGVQKSRPIKDIIENAKELLKRGVKEIVLIGQNVNAYGMDKKGDKPLFLQLLYQINSLKGLKRFSFTSPHPFYFDLDFIKGISKLDKMIKSIHLPIQSGSNKILKLMKRYYTREDIFSIVKDLRYYIPDISITTDVIVGFPQETEQDFLDTLDLIEKVRFSQAYMFAYSKRKGTIAAKMSGQIPDNIKMDRLYRLIEIQNNIMQEENNKYLGKIEDILVEGISKKDKNKYIGRNNNYKIVVFPAINNNLIGDFVKVKINKAYIWGLEGNFI